VPFVQKSYKFKMREQKNDKREVIEQEVQLW